MLKCSCQTKLSRLPKNELEATSPMLADVAKRFDDMNFRVSVLNVCETGFTKVKSLHPLNLRSKNVVVCIRS